MRNRYLTFCITTFFITLFLISTTITASAKTLTGTCGENAQYSYNTSTGAMIISGSGAIADYAFSDALADGLIIKKVTIKSGITSIGSSAFQECTNMKSIVIPEGLRTIGFAAFQLSGLTSVSIPSSVESIGEYAFNCSKNLAKVTISNGVKYIGERAFSSTNISSLVIPSSVRTIGKEAFCSIGIGALEKLTIKNGVQVIGNGAFSENDLLTSVTIPSSVVTIGQDAFSQSGVEKLTLPNGLKTIGKGAFEGTELKTVTIPSSVNKIGEKAFHTRELEKAYIKSKNAEIGKLAFSNWSAFGSYPLVYVYGYKGSTAEKFAQKTGMGFRTFGVKKPKKPQILSLSNHKTRANTVLKIKKVPHVWKYEILILKSTEFDTRSIHAFTKKHIINFKGISKKYTNTSVYVRVRVHTKVNGKITVSDWSKVKRIKMKK